MKPPRKEFHIAPMLDVSTVEFRYFMRLLTKRSFIWTEMVVAETLVYNTKKNTTNSEAEDELDPTLRRLCGWWDESDFFNGQNLTGHEVVNPHPTVCQIGTNDPEQAAFATRIVEKCGYDRIDLNAECPSDRVTGKREFGAALMKDQCAATSVVKSIVEAVNSRNCATIRNKEYSEGQKCLPFSVKTRIGVDENDSFDFIVDFIQQLVDAGCRRFVIHARKVYTQGLSPAQNRTVPPLNYPCVYCLIEKFPECEFLLNGGIMSLDHARKVAFGDPGNESEDGRNETQQNECEATNNGHSVPCNKCNLPHGSCLAPPSIAPLNLHGVMVGRLARDHPSELADVDRYFYGETSNPCKNRRELMEKYIAFLERVYPRRCCDDDEMITLGMATTLEQTISQQKQCCNVCKEFVNEEKSRSHPYQEEYKIDKVVESFENCQLEIQATNRLHTQQKSQSEKRHKRLTRKSPGAKIISRVIDRALQPTLGILFGLPGNSKFRRELHRLSRDMSVRNCGPGFMLKKAMLSVSQDCWDQPFVLNDGTLSTKYVPSK